MNEQDRAKLSKMNATLNRWAVGVLGKQKRTRRLSYAQALAEADRCRMRMKRFGHY